MTGDDLRHGVFLAPFHALDEDPTLCLQRDLQLMELVDDLGFAEAWIGEHHSGGVEPIASPELFIAAAAQRTTRLRFGTGVVSLPYHHPFMVAERLVQLDHMTMGRVMLGVGPGLLASDALMLGIAPAVTRDRMAQGLDAVLRLLRGEVVTEDAGWYQLQDAQLQLLPYTRPHPEVAVASAVTPWGASLAGRHGLGMLCVAATDSRGFDALGTNWAVACEVAEQHGRHMDRSRLRAVGVAHVAETRERARADVRWGLQQYVDYMNLTLPGFVVPEGVDVVDWAIDNGVAVIGTPDDVVQMVEALLAKQGGFGCFLLQSHNWADWDATRRSYELYARYVVPHFEEANVARVRSYRRMAARRDELNAARTAAARGAIARFATDRDAGDGRTPEGAA